MKKNQKISVKGSEINIISQNGEDYISLTDMVKSFGEEIILYNWLRNRDTIEFLGIWETIYNPDFNYLSLRGSAVLRWEYLRGSTLYFVWTQNRQDTEPTGEFNFGHSFNNLFNLNADNIFLIKISYWL